MRILVLSDIHSNAIALEAVLDAVRDWDTVWCLGDTIGYGPNPNECIDRLRELPHMAIPGNHDWGVLGKAELEKFNLDARRANLWNREQLTPENRDYLEALPLTRSDGEFTLAHGSPRDPIWEYLLYGDTACKAMGALTTRLALVGHTHIPVVFVERGEDHGCGMGRPPVGEPFALPEARCIINPGSVGQPRDGDPRASCMVINTKEIILEHRRIAYDIEETQARMRAVELPHRLSARLELGW